MQSLDLRWGNGWHVSIILMMICLFISYGRSSPAFFFPSVLRDGVRNYQARNFLKSMKLQDLAFFYHSNCKEPGK